MLVTEPIWQSGLLAQGNDAGEWMNILFIVVVAVFWAIGGIVKAAGAGRTARQRQNKQSSEKDTPRRETWLQQLARKAEEIQRAVENQGKPQARRTQERQPQAKPPKPPAGQVTVRTDRGGEPVLVYERQTPSPAVQRQEQPARRVSKARTYPQRERQAKATLTPVSLLDYSDPDALKRAILHYEILGKPLAFRDPLERSSPF